MTLYNDMFSTDQEVDLVGTSSELDNDDDDDDEDDDDDDEDDDYYDDDSNGDDEFDGLSLNEEAEIMQYAIANAAQQHQQQQQQNSHNHHLQQQQQQQHHHLSVTCDNPLRCGQPDHDLANGIGTHPSHQNNYNNSNYDFATTTSPTTQQQHQATLMTTCQNRTNCSNSSGSSGCDEPNPNWSMYNSSEKLIMESSLFDTKTRLIGTGVVLLVSTFALLVLLPLYFQQMVQNGERFNIFGATFFLSCNSALVFLLITVALGVAIKWKIPFHKPPLPWTKLIMISLCYGLSCILFATSCYQRVPCHLQDPLKGAALVFSLIFYFFFCRKVMGLQRIFSATTAVVGLFISVDYGLCDEFRCRGTDLVGKVLQDSLNADSPTSQAEWRNGVIWALLYIVGIALWSLHVALLESSLVLSPTKEKRPFTMRPLSLLRTVSRLVAKTESTLPTMVHTPTKNYRKKEEETKIEQQEQEKEVEEANPLDIDGFKSHPLHIAVWVHVLVVIVVGAFGWIDIFPVTGPIKSLGRHIQDTGNTVLCHLNIPIGAVADGTPPSSVSRQPGDSIPDLELLSNFVPGSASFNETIQKLRRYRREVNSTQQQKEHHQQHSLELHFNYTTTRHHANGTGTATMTQKKHLNHFKSRNNSTVHHAAKKETHRRPENYFPWKLWQGVSPGTSHSRMNLSLETALNNLLSGERASGRSMASSSNSEVIGNCGRTQIYSIVLLLVYVLFAGCLISFLVVSESAVFTVCVVTGALPLVGIFWSLFEISFDLSDQTVGLIWSPEVSGELICSLLGTPIVFLGIGLLCRAYFNEQFMLLDDQMAISKAQVTDSSIPVSFDNCNYYSSYLETGLGGGVAATTGLDETIHNQNGMLGEGQ